MNDLSSGPVDQISCKDFAIFSCGGHIVQQNRKLLSNFGRGPLTFI